MKKRAVISTSWIQMPKTIANQIKDTSKHMNKTSFQFEYDDAD